MATAVLTADIATIVAGILFAGALFVGSRVIFRPIAGAQAVGSSMGSYTDDESEVAAVLAANAELRMRRVRWRARLTGVVRDRRVGATRSQRRRMPNVERDFEAGFRRIMKDYFGWRGRPALYNEHVFERRFRLPRAIVFEMYAKLQDKPFWRRSINATGRPQAYTLQKLVAALRVLAYGTSYDQPDEYVRLGAATVMLATHKFVEFIVEHYQATYLRPPNNDELKTILRRNAARGVPGCIGSIDCTHWTWSACPKGLAGQYQGRGGKRTVVIETVCDADAYIWHFYIGSPGSHNDMNVLNASPLFMDIKEGLWPPRNFTYKANNRTRRLLYFLSDSGYPTYPIFVQPHPNPNTIKKRTFNRLQEALRKEAERLYAIKRKRFNIALYPARFAGMPTIINVGKAVAIMHNMATAHRRSGYLGQMRMEAAAELRQENGESSGNEDGFEEHPAPDHGVWGPPLDEDGADGAVLGHDDGPLVEGTPQYIIAAEQEATDVAAHHDLREDLTEHVYKDRGHLLEPYL